MSNFSPEAWFLVSQANTLKTKKETLWTACLEDFLLSGRVEGKKAKTLEWYKVILTPFVNYLNQEGLSQLTLRKYVNSLYDRLKITSVDAHVRAIKVFLNFLYKEGYWEENLSSTLKRPRLPKQFPHVLNDEQANLLLKAPNKKTWEGYRNYVMLLTFLDTGIRLSELLALTIDRTNLMRGSLLVEGKVEKDREVCAGKTLRKEMSRWLKRRGLCLYEGRC
ncbi:MAG: tyrosine-type recombinase/integrase, partial [Candidatus Atribacteria bacterium]|nr:tyrosine-type recombinase/integrase [Candidatus Atribacteria bacterium]